MVCICVMTAYLVPNNEVDVRPCFWGPDEKEAKLDKIEFELVSYFS